MHTQRLGGEPVLTTGNGNGTLVPQACIARQVVRGKRLFEPTEVNVHESIGDPERGLHVKCHERIAHDLHVWPECFPNPVDDIADILVARDHALRIALPELETGLTSWACDSIKYADKIVSVPLTMLRQLLADEPICNRKGP